MAEVHTEKHYKVPELAKLSSLSDDFVRDLFKDEPGVLQIARPENVRELVGSTAAARESVPTDCA